MIRSIRFVGVRTGAIDDMTTLYRDLLGAEPIDEGPDAARFRAADGTAIDVYSAADADHDFFGSGPVVGFRIDDFAATRARLAGAGIAFVGEPQRAGGAIWNHFVAPDGNVYEIIGTDPDAAS
jgi:catechol 2,3-dioxygenase-like lactoylglutathione lyase family enzyme